MKKDKKKGLLSRTRYQSDLLLELLPLESDSLFIKVKRFRQEARLALKAAELVIGKFVRGKWFSYKGFESIGKKFSCCIMCLKELIACLEHVFRLKRQNSQGFNNVSLREVHYSGIKIESLGGHINGTIV